MILLVNLKKVIITLICFFALHSVAQVFAQTTPLTSSLSTTGQLSVGKVAPGEKLPIQVQLINFGTPEERVDVTLFYSVKDSHGITVLTDTETVAVQTTASFIKNVYIPDDFKSDNYTINLVINYRDQEFSAISQAQFKVQKKYFGFFLSDWLRALPLLFLPFLIPFFLNFRKKEHDLLRPNYSHIPEDERTYYEIVHDIVASIHHHVGDRDMKKIVDSIPGLGLDVSNIYIEELEGSVVVIIARLVSAYEKIVGKKANIILKANYQKNRIQTH